MILFIDDEKRYVQNYIEELQDIGFEVSFINNVRDALEFIKSPESKEIEAIILDAMMPPNGIFLDDELEVGVQLYTKLQEHLEKIRIFVLTNSSREEVKNFFETKKCSFNRKDDVMPFEFANKIYKELRK